MSKSEKKLAVGDRVSTETHGEGVVALISQKETPEGQVAVYAVSFENGETRHFTANELG